MIAIWQVEIEEYCDSTGGSQKFFVFTSSPLEVPSSFQIGQAFDDIRGKEDCDLIEIKRLTLVGTIPTAWWSLKDITADVCRLEEKLTG